MGRRRAGGRVESRGGYHRRIVRDQPRAPSRGVLEELSSVRLDVPGRGAVVPRHPSPEPPMVLNELVVDAPSGEEPRIAGPPLHYPWGDPETPERGEVGCIELQRSDVKCPIRIPGPGVGTAALDRVYREQRIRRNVVADAGCERAPDERRAEHATSPSSCPYSKDSRPRSGSIQPRELPARHASGPPRRVSRVPSVVAGSWTALSPFRPSGHIARTPCERLHRDPMTQRDAVHVLSVWVSHPQSKPMRDCQAMIIATRKMAQNIAPASMCCRTSRTTNRLRTVMIIS